MSTRNFQICKGYEKANLKLPVRSTTNSAGYDFFAAETVELPSILSTLWNWIRKREVKPVLVKTGIKAKMRSNEVLFVFNRSSNPGKGLLLANGVGVIDADYFSNLSNDGNIGFAFYNIKPWAVTIHKGDKIGQGVFTSFLKTEKDTPSATKRIGGFGSTGK